MRFLKKAFAYYYLNKQKFPKEIQSYLESIYKSLNVAKRQGRDESLRYVIFDTETTGFNIKKDAILSIGAVAIRGSEIYNEDTFYFVIKNYQSQTEAIEVHGILPKESQTGEELQVVLLKFLSYIGDSILVGHHIDFDVEFLNQFLQKFFGIKIFNYRIDTARLARSLFQLTHINHYEMRFPQLDLDSLCKQYKISTESRHNSLGDSYITAELFLKLTSRLKKLGKSKLKTWLSLG